MGALRLFTIATCAPALLIGAAIVLGGVWGWAALGYMTALAFWLDRLVAREAENHDPDAEFPAADTLLTVLGLAHFVLLAGAVWATTDSAGLTQTDTVLVVLTTAFFAGQITHPAAHELIHRNARPLRLLGRLMYSSLLMGHHASAHLRVHHVHVGSDADPNSARAGEGFYRFALRASVGSFRAGLAAENRLRAGRARSWLDHPYTFYLTIAAAILGAGWALGGALGLAALLGIALFAQSQILMSDYVQHYGLRRLPLPNGKLEPVGPHHSWNSPHWFTSAMLLNAPRHSDHHVTPSRPFPALQLDTDAMPILPMPVPMMGVIATIPPLWRRIMDPRCAHWRARHPLAPPRPLATAAE